jgi:amino acid transporter
MSEQTHERVRGIRRQQRLAAAYPETWQYRLKNRVLGPPMVTERLSSEKLKKKVALGVLGPDMISSSAYGTEEMLIVLVPLIGFGAFTMVIPITVAILAVLFFVTLSYLEILGHYIHSGGAYVVARTNFGSKFAQIAAVALLIDYTVTVAVQVSAGTAAMTSAFPSLLTNFPLFGDGTVPITVAVVVLMFYANLRGLKEAGSWFAAPVYFFVASLGIVVTMGFIKGFTGNLHAHAIPAERLIGYHLGHERPSAIFLGLSVFYLLKAFANGGASLTGLEAVSNGIDVFENPKPRNGRIVLIAMCVILGYLVLGTSLIAHWTHAVPYLSGSPTVVSQEVHYVLGNGSLGRVLFYVVQFATMAILFTGGNTSFNGFPFLASYVASDHYLPRQLTKRGHRLAFSNGIFMLTVVAITLIVAFKANVNSLVALYAIGVFTGFTIAGAGMLKQHLTKREGRWHLGVVVNGFSAGLSGAVVLILLVTKFAEGAWLIFAVSPPMYFGLLHLRKQYDKEEAVLAAGVASMAEAPSSPNHLVVVFVDRLDVAAARAIQYARSLKPDNLRAIHFNLDSLAAVELVDSWAGLGIGRFPLDIVECRDRRLDRAALEFVADIVADGTTECTVLLPRRIATTRLSRVLHDRSADKIAAALTVVPHVAATIVPFRLRDAGKSLTLDDLREEDVVAAQADLAPIKLAEIDLALAERAEGTVRIADVETRRRAKVAGRVRSMRVLPARDTQNLECVVTDDTGDLVITFTGRSSVPGIIQGTRLIAEAMVADRDGVLLMTNPEYELVAEPEE